MVGTPENDAFASACHGAGRVWSRHRRRRAHQNRRPADSPRCRRSMRRPRERGRGERGR
ncbi:RtcB family protein [Streptomyces sp. NBS 14/10]|uniref:RtcB family protein n=1 Tax=Streptomyces sp. NBS 14/10 TaxID=1945643 RepID=UPI00211AFF68|nr:RtcB family protein [Streptomyces sp. NBS 14/10]KAK1186437.1 RtcB family protein [Streptomyces sp. NBS 14/10]